MTMSFLGGSTLYDDEGEIDSSRRQELPQASIVMMYSLPDATKANGELDDDFAIISATLS